MAAEQQRTSHDETGGKKRGKKGAKQQQQQKARQTAATPSKQQAKQQVQILQRGKVKEEPSGEKEKEEELEVFPDPANFKFDMSKILAAMESTPGWII